jgi:hypothetical protein
MIFRWFGAYGELGIAAAEFHNDDGSWTRMMTSPVRGSAGVDRSH